MHSIQTPAILLDLNILERNIKNASVGGGKQLWPMLKTHKSTEIARMQLENGCTGFLCGTLDECEAVCAKFVQGQKRDIGIMYAYPVASETNIARAIKLARECDFYVRLDHLQQAKLLNNAAKEAGVVVNYSVIINCGLDRFGIAPVELELFLCKMAGFTHLKFCGISTHSGHVYREASQAWVQSVAQQESDIMSEATAVLHRMGTQPQFVGSGCTPTHPIVKNDGVIDMLHPGNYVFMDNFQITLGVATEQDCALTVLATVIAAPRNGEFIIDAGAKCFGLDKGAHGNTKIQGFGRVKGFPMAEVYSLSEEVGKIIVQGESEIKIGDTLEIIPNHACATANNTSYFVGTRNGVPERSIYVDMRGNSQVPPLLVHRQSNLRRTHQSSSLRA